MNQPAPASQMNQPAPASQMNQPAPASHTHNKAPHNASYKAPHNAPYNAPYKEQRKVSEGKPKYAPFALILNENCPAGKDCPNLDNPLNCPKNHDGYDHVIKQGDELPENYCEYECPWKKGPNGKPMRCRNPKCRKSHLDKRQEFIANYKAYKQSIAE
jgi:hypothetical protein